jgi:hypothetical protein
MPTLIKAVPNVSGHIVRFYFQIDGVSFPIDDLYVHVRRRAVQAGKELVFDIDKDIGWLGPDPAAAMAVIETKDLDNTPIRYMLTFIVATDG